MKKSEVQKVLINKNADGVGTMYLYGVIGQYDWERRNDDPANETITDMAIVKAITEMEQEGVTRLNIRLNSPGGSEKHGDGIVATIKASKMDIHTYNDGMVASKATDIFLSVKKENRHAPVNAKIMIHAPSAMVHGNEKELREAADMLKVFTDTGISQMAEDTGMSEDDIRKNYFDGKDHWITSSEAAKIGLISQVESYKIEGTPEDIEKMTLPEVVKYFRSTETSKSLSIIEKIQARIDGLLPTKSIQKNNSDMDINEFKQSLTEKKMTTEDVTKVMAEMGFTVTPTEQDPPVKPAVEKKAEFDVEAIVAAVEKKMEEKYEAKITKLETDIQKLGDEPGAKPTGIASNGDDYSTMNEEQVADIQKLDALNEKFAKAGESGTVTFGV